MHLSYFSAHLHACQGTQITGVLAGNVLVNLKNKNKWKN